MPGLGRELMRSLGGVTPKLIADREWRLGALTVVVGNERTQLRYARERVGQARSTPEEIVAAWKRALERLRERSLPPDELLPKLAAAYKKLLARKKQPAGARVPLVEIRSALRGTSRAQFAWDVARLRKERRLVVGGKRIDFGIATGHSAMHRSRVVWIEDDSGSGAFYESFRLVDQPGARA